MSDSRDGTGRTPPAHVTTSGVELGSFYSPADVAELDYGRDLGNPGEYPFTRGTRPSGYRGRKWTVRQVMGLGTAEETNERLRYLLREGQTGISLTGLGYAHFESSDPRAAGLVGRGGVWVDTLDDVDLVFREVPIERTSINQTGNSIPAFCMILATAKRRGIPLADLSGTIQNYVLPWGEPPKYSGNHYVDVIEYCAKHLPRWNHTSISVRNTRESGISAAQEIAFGLYEGWYAAATAKERGADVNRVGRRLTFFLNAESDFLEEVAKFRAVRRMWARIMRERLGATDDRACQLRFHVQTSGVALTAQQPLNNVVRATLHALAAALGGAQSMSVNAFDEAFTIPSKLAQTLSVRTQQIIQLESGVTAVADPLGGSWAIEVLTNELESRAREIFAELGRLSAEGAWRHISACTRDAAYRRQLEIDDGRRPVVGVNCFVEEDEEEPSFGPVSHRAEPDYDPAWREKQIRRLERVKRERDPGGAEAARRRLAEAYRLREPIVEPTLEAAEAYLSIGEIVETLAAVAGETELRKRGGFMIRLY
ncbi:MAG: methylmalonyl-CoA mutase, N-terminal domain [Candidatus Binatota bacterium]|nr:methylmalonyl-CoA mutase, N-terminal domain [Candidatus Binatota bacterium]